MNLPLVRVPCPHGRKHHTAGGAWMNLIRLLLGLRGGLRVLVLVVVEGDYLHPQVAVPGRNYSDLIGLHGALHSTARQRVADHTGGRI